MFEAPRSTPELSFAVRYYNATAGINITASHNPPAYNGYKVYFEDGGQIIEPHASAIIRLVDSMDGEKYEPLPLENQGSITMLGIPLDEVYKARLKTLLLDPSLLQQQPPIKVIYTPLHGVGGVIIVPMLQELGINCLPVPSQMVADGWFSTVKSPNPENAEALSLGITLANEENASLVLATDPDNDRMGVAVRNVAGEMELLTGNQIGSLLLWYRLKQLFAQGILNDQNKARAVIIKSLVTTDLQKVIAEKQGVRCVETLTGFKYIGAKQGNYEAALPAEIQAVYRQLSEEKTREARLQNLSSQSTTAAKSFVAPVLEASSINYTLSSCAPSTPCSSSATATLKTASKASSYFVFGGEESYGYNMGDFVRDKDGNAAVLCFCEVAAYARSEGITVTELLDRIYYEYGFYLERGESLGFEGAEGADKIKRLMASYEAAPFKNINGIPVLSIHNFDTEQLCDSEGEAYPAEAMLMIKLEGNRQVVVRPSGTEPKIKYYLFAATEPSSFVEVELQHVKSNLAAELEHLWQWLKADLQKRMR